MVCTVKIPGWTWDSWKRWRAAGSPCQVEPDENQRSFCGLSDELDQADVTRDIREASV